jgi:hypothetical protein
MKASEKAIGILALAAWACIWTGALQAQSGSSSDSRSPSSTPGAAQTSTPPDDASQTNSTSATPAQSKSGDSPDAKPGEAPVTGDVEAPAQKPNPAKDGSGDKKKGKGKDKAGSDAVSDTDVDPGKVVEVGSQKVNVKPGSIEDVNAVGNRDIGGRGLSNWYSTDYEIRMGKSYSMEIEKSVRMINDPVIVEYVNRVGQNIVKNSDCKVPFTIKVIDSDEINAMALPGGFFYVNSGLILNADEEAELAGVMAHETAHVCAHHAVREMTRANWTQIGMVPVMIMVGGWTGYGIYEGSQLAIPIAFLKFSRDFEAQADYLGVQYMYRAGYDPQAFITFFEKIQALEKRKPGMVSRAFSDHPQTPDRILHSQEEIARILPARDEYTVTTSEFDDIKARLARIENKRRLTDSKAGQKPSLRKASTKPEDGSGSSTPSSQTGDSQSSGDDHPTLHRRDDQN